LPSGNSHARIIANKRRIATAFSFLSYIALEKSVLEGAPERCADTEEMQGGIKES
jgi:hypothetical protein